MVRTSTPAAGADAGPAQGASDASPGALLLSAPDASVRAPSVSGGLTSLHRPRDVARALREAPEVDVAWALAAFVSLLADPGLGWDSGHLSAAAVLLAAATSVPLVVRRRYPLGVLVAVAGGLLACLAVFHPNIAAVGVIMFALYNVGLQGRRLRSLLVGVAMAPIVTAAVAITGDDGLTVGPPLARLALLLCALAAGDARRGRLALARTRAEETERQREAAAVHRFDEERLRLAHELHDTIAHSLVGINTQAAAAVHLQRKRPNESLDALQHIVRSSGDALAELRSTLKMIRPGTDNAPLRPAQSLADLPELVDGVRSAGVDVDLQMDPISREIPAATAHGAYRIVQESLTNILRHSTASRATVRVELGDDHLSVDVLDDGRRGGRDSRGPGHGVQGMIERAATLGGRCEAGAAPDGGWRVHATLPARMAS
jgi:signal transduction histidine kinase